MLAAASGCVGGALLLTFISTIPPHAPTKPTTPAMPGADVLALQNAVRSLERRIQALESVPVPGSTASTNAAIAAVPSAPRPERSKGQGAEEPSLNAAEIAELLDDALEEESPDTRWVLASHVEAAPAQVLAPPA